MRSRARNSRGSSHRSSRRRRSRCRCRPRPKRRRASSSRGSRHRSSRDIRRRNSRDIRRGSSRRRDRHRRRHASRRRLRAPPRPARRQRGGSGEGCDDRQGASERGEGGLHGGSCGRTGGRPQSFDSPPLPGPASGVVNALYRAAVARSHVPFVEEPHDRPLVSGHLRASVRHPRRSRAGGRVGRPDRVIRCQKDWSRCC